MLLVVKMGKIYGFLCLFVFFFNFLNAQKFSSSDLIEAWKSKDVTQTIKAEETYKDLKLHKDSVKLKKIIDKLDEILLKQKDDRLYIRIVMYKTLAVLEFHNKLQPKHHEELETAMKKAVFLNDEQLLSELYTLFSEQGSEQIEDNLFYLTKAIEIQQKIGVEYFPLINHRFLVLSHSYYFLEEYEESFKYAKIGLELIQNPEAQIINYCMFNDLIAASAYELKDVETGIKHYQNILNVVEKYQPNSKKYEKTYSLHEPGFGDIWTAVAQGGVGKGYFLQKRYDEAIPLLESNIKSALKTKQLNDAAKAQNILAQISHIKGDYQTALSLWKESYQWAGKSLYADKHLMDAVNGISESFFMLNKYDSAYFYNNKYQTLKFENFEKINQKKLNSVNSRIKYEKLRTVLANTNTDLQYQKYIRNLILILSIAIIIIGIVLYGRYRFRQKSKFKQLENQKKIAEIEVENANIKTAQAQRQLKDFKEKLKLNLLITETISEEKQDEISHSVERLMGSTILTEEDWQNFRQQFSTVFPALISLLEYNYPNISQSDIRYLCLIKLDLSHKEIAAALGISAASLRVTWHRLRKKLELENEVSPQQFLENFERK